MFRLNSKDSTSDKLNGHHIRTEKRLSSTNKKHQMAIPGHLVVLPLLLFQLIYLMIQMVLIFIYHKRKLIAR